MIERSIFFYKTNRFESILNSSRFESIRIANRNALLFTLWYGNDSTTREVIRNITMYNKASEEHCSVHIQMITSMNEVIRAETSTI